MNATNYYPTTYHYRLPVIDLFYEITPAQSESRHKLGRTALEKAVLQARCPSCCLTNSVKALWGLY